MVNDTDDVKITELPTEISRNALKEIIENDPRFSGKDFTVDYDKASGLGDNYLSELYRIKIIMAAIILCSLNVIPTMVQPAVTMLLISMILLHVRWKLPTCMCREFILPFTTAFIPRTK